jgi:hypothetical protein
MWKSKCGKVFNGLPTGMKKHSEFCVPSLNLEVENLACSPLGSALPIVYESHGLVARGKSSIFSEI